MEPFEILYRDKKGEPHWMLPEGWVVIDEDPFYCVVGVTIAAKYLGIARSTLYRWVSTGKISFGVQMRCPDTEGELHLRFPVDDLKKYVEEHQGQALKS